MFWSDYPYASKYVIYERVASRKIFCSSLVAECADLMLEEVNVVLIIPLVTELSTEAPNARHVFRISGFRFFARLLQIKSIRR